MQAMFQKGYGTVMDSGTTFTYLPTAAFDAFVASVAAAVESKGLKMSTGPDPGVSNVGAVNDNLEHTLRYVECDQLFLG